MEKPGMVSFGLKGRFSHKMKNLWFMYESAMVVPMRRLFRGPLMPGWPLAFEMSHYMLKKITSHGFAMESIEESRKFEDTIQFKFGEQKRIQRIPVEQPVRGDWILPDNLLPDKTILYLHGGGYAYYSYAYLNITAMMAVTTQSRLFVPDYPLAPEHPYPAQLDYALKAWDWLVAGGTSPESIVVMGDSAGGNLTVALLLKLRELDRPQPALAVCLAPWIDLENRGESMLTNNRTDWIDSSMPVKWARWYAGSADPADPLISPANADLRNLAPIYIQDGDAEILHDQILAFKDEALRQGARVELDTWKNMVHVFHAYGDLIPESREALKKISGKILSV